MDKILIQMTSFFEFYDRKKGMQLYILDACKNSLASLKCGFIYQESIIRGNFVVLAKI